MKKMKSMLLKTNTGFDDRISSQCRSCSRRRGRATKHIKLAVQRGLITLISRRDQSHSGGNALRQRCGY